MPNILNENGLQTATRAEWITFFTEVFQEIYGSDVNLASDTPDGQLMNIMTQIILDMQDLMAEVYSSFDPDNAIGVTLDQRVSINGIQRQGGTYTIQPIQIVNDRSINLYGLDQTDQEIYTVEDNAGNRWILIDTELGLDAGTHTLNFRAEEPGAQLTIPNTITTAVTIVLGVTSINNPSTYSSLGEDEESDAQLKIRRQKSVSLSSQGYLAGLIAALENINGVTSAFVYENTTSTTDENGVPGHSIWVIVAGSAAEADIAQAIYTKRNAGAGMYGDESYTIDQLDGTQFNVNWDYVVVRNLFIAFTASSINGTTPPNVELIRQQLPIIYIPGVSDEVEINELATKVQEIDENCLVTNAGFTRGDSQILNLSGIPASGVFKVNYNGVASENINWDDNISQIEDKVQDIAGLEDCVMSGSLAGQSITFDLSNVGEIQSLIFASDNTLETGASAEITFSYDYNLVNILSTVSRQNQFVVSSENILITPLRISPSVQSVGVETEIQFSGIGGYGSYIYEISTNNSGGTIGASTGLYESGSTGDTVDTVRVTDSLGNTTTATVQVV